MHRRFFLASIALLVGSARLAAELYTVVDPQNLALPRTYAPGGSVTLTVGVNGSGSSNVPGELQWLHDDVAVPGATRSSLNLNNLSPQDAGNYRLRLRQGAADDYSPTITINVRPLPPSPVDVTFTAADPGPSRTYNKVYGSMADGHVFVRQGPAAGAAGDITRLNTDGSVDPNFTFPSGDSSRTILAIYPDGKLIVSTAPYRLFSDGSFSPLPLPAGFDAAKPLTAAAVQADGQLLIAQGTRLARLKTDDSTDLNFSYVTTLNPSHTIRAIKPDGFGHIYIDADIALPAGATHPSTPVVLRLNNTGAEDGSFAREIQTQYLYDSASLDSHPLNDGRVLIVRKDTYGTSLIMRRLDGAVDSTSGGQFSLYLINSIVVDPTGRLFFSQFGVIHRIQLGVTGGVEDATFYSGDGYAASLAITADGKLLVTTTSPTWDAHPTRGLVRLRSSDAMSPGVRSVTITRDGGYLPRKGARVTLEANVNGTGAFNYEWLALDGQPLEGDIHASRYVIPSFSGANMGRYQVRVTGADGNAVLSEVLAFEYSAADPYLANLSGRAITGTGENTIIAGLASRITTGTAGMPVLIRGAGPALQKFGITNFLPNPVIDVYDARGGLIANNDQWSIDSQIATAASAVGAFAFSHGSDDAALLRDFSSGTATVMLRSQDGRDGVALVEVYQRFPKGDEFNFQSLLNLSLRARTGPGERTAIAGFVIVDPLNLDRPARVLVRAVGPTLTAQGIVHPLENPVLTVFNSKGEVVAQNDDWSVNNTSAEATALVEAAKQVGAFALPADSKDAALLLDLPAGAYTIHASGGEGVTLLEIYLVR